MADVEEFLSTEEMARTLPSSGYLNSLKICASGGHWAGVRASQDSERMF